MPLLLSARSSAVMELIAQDKHVIVFNEVELQLCRLRVKKS